MTVVSTSSDIVVLGGREPSADWLSALSASRGGLELVLWRTSRPLVGWHRLAPRAPGWPAGARWAPLRARRRPPPVGRGERFL